MKTMMQLTALVFGVFLISVAAWGTPYPEGGPYTEVVEGIEWTFMVTNGEAAVGTGSWQGTAVSTMTSGDIVIPTQLGCRTVSRIEKEAFTFCGRLRSVFIPPCVTHIDNYAFSSCGLNYVHIPESVTNIGDSAFSFSKLKCVTIPSSVRTLETTVFFGCSDLTSVIIPPSVTSIGASAFCDCSKLAEVTIPPNVKSIGSSAFQGCVGLTNMTVSASVTSVGWWAFRQCNGQIDFEGAPPVGLSDADIATDTIIRYNVAYTYAWIPIITKCGWTNATPYTPSPKIVGVTAMQRYPWNGKVDISYNVANAGTDDRILSVWAIDRMSGLTNVASHVTGDTDYTDGDHHIVWDMTADGLTSVSTNVVFVVTYKEPLYCIIDISGGMTVETYPVSYLIDVPSNGWSEEYKTTKFVLRKIKAGSFTMGSPTKELGRNDDETEHQVTLTKDYWIGVFPFTQRQWELVMGTRPSYFNNSSCYATRPVENISYTMIRGSSAGTTWPSSAEVDSSSFLGVLRQKANRMFDLPTEAQWECACRAGTVTALNSGENLTSVDQDSEMSKVGRYLYNGGADYLPRDCDLTEGTAAVGSYQANAWGLYDMHGNILEWCLDRYLYEPYPEKEATDPVGPSTGSNRVLRGGRWSHRAGWCRSAMRVGGTLGLGEGFRLCCPATSSQDIKLPDAVGYSMPVCVDLTIGTRMSKKKEVLTYSTSWDIDPEVSAVAEVSINGMPIISQSGSGTVEWTPKRNGTYELTHKVYEDGTIIGDVLSATFIATGINPEPPEIFPASGTTFDTSLTVTMTCASEDATIRYSTDGSEPTMESPEYNKFRIYGKTTVKARAFYDDGAASETSVSEYAMGTCDVPVITPPDGTIYAHSGQRVSIEYTSDEGVLRYTTDGSDPTESSPKYTGSFTIDETTTIKAKAFGDQYFDSSIVTATLTRTWIKVDTPQITAAETFTGTKNKVEISCATDGATIYYTLDGSDPTATSLIYEKPFCVSESCTVKAMAAQYDYLDSDVAARGITKTWCIGQTMGKPDHAFATSGDAAFERVDDATAELGESMKSGKIADKQKSILSTTVVGPGTLSFKWKTSCEEDPPLQEWDHAEFAVDGAVKKLLDGETDWMSVSQRIEGDNEHTVTWTYVKDSSEFKGKDCLWVSEYVWESDYTTTQTTDVPVPYDWLKATCSDVVDEFDSYEKVAKQKAVNKRLSVEQCYVTGVDPESTTNDFVSAIEVRDGIPCVTWNPDLKDKRTYKIWGKKSLEDGSESWMCPTNALHRFFRVTVEMK